jgi:hypothetical protein
MNRMFTDFLASTVVGSHLLAGFRQRAISKWQRHGRTMPPPHAVKQRTLLEFAKTFSLDVLVETGTYYGDMVQAMKPHFRRIYSIELSDRLFQQARRRFAGDEHVRILHGDSGDVIADVIAMLDAPALFWLDGHYSAGITAKGDNDTPVHLELCRILADEHRSHVIVIDDARLFGVDPAYPRLDEIRQLVARTGTAKTIEIEDDSIRVFPVRP